MSRRDANPPNQNRNVSENGDAGHTTCDSPDSPFRPGPPPSPSAPVDDRQRLQARHTQVSLLDPSLSPSPSPSPRSPSTSPSPSPSPSPSTSLETPSFWRAALAFAFPEPIGQKYDISLCFHNDWLLSPKADAAGPYTLHFYDDDSVVISHGPDLNGHADDNNPDHADHRTGRTFTVSLIRVPSTLGNRAPDQDHNLILTPVGEQPGRSPGFAASAFTHVLVAIVVAILSVAITLYVLSLGGVVPSSGCMTGSQAMTTGRRSDTITTQHLLAYLETLMLRVLPLKFHHHQHDDHLGTCDIWWPTEALMAYASAVEELHTLARHGSTTNPDPQEPYATLARHARMAARQLQELVRVVFESWEADLALLLIDIDDALEAPSATLSTTTPRPTTQPYPWRNETEGTLARVLGSWLLAYNTTMETWAAQLVALEHHLHETQIWDKMVINMLLERVDADLGSEHKGGWWSEDIVFSTKRLWRELIPRRDAVRGLVNEALLALESAQDVVAASVQELEMIRLQRRLRAKDARSVFAAREVLLSGISHTAHRLRDLEQRAATRDGAVAARPLVTVDKPMHRRLHHLDQSTAGQWEWVAKVWPLGSVGARPGEDSDEIPGEMFKADCRGHSEWYTVLATTEAVTRRPSPTLPPKVV